VILVEFCADLDDGIDDFGTDLLHFAGEKGYKKNMHDLPDEEELV
jgi:hypothetical protein